jgi:hypothetical protein
MSGWECRSDGVESENLLRQVGIYDGSIVLGFSSHQGGIPGNEQREKPIEQEVSHSRHSGEPTRHTGTHELAGAGEATWPWNEGSMLSAWRYGQRERRQL